MGNGVLTTLHSNYKEQVSVGAIDEWIQEIEQKTNDTTAPQKKTQVVVRNPTERDLQLSSAEHNSTNDETQSTQDALPSVVSFQGVTGLSAPKINGIYSCKTEKHPTKPGEIVEDKKIFYRHQSQSSWRYDSILLNDSQGRWMVLRGNQVLAYCELSGLADPCDAKRWHIANASKSLPSFSVQLGADVKREDVKELQKLGIRTKPKPAVRSAMFALCRACEILFADMCSDKNHIKDAPRKQLTLSMEDPIKKKITPYMKALEKLKSRNRKKLITGKN